MSEAPEKQPSMRQLVAKVRAAAVEWCHVDDLPSPPATAEMLRASDRKLALAIENLCRAYPKHMGCERHPAGHQS